MTDRNIEDIDKLFREGLNPEDNHFTFDEGGWQKMEQRLNRQAQRKRGVFWLTRLGSVAALLLLFFVLRTVFTDNRPQVAQHTEFQQKDQPATTKKSEEKPKGEPVKEGEKQSITSAEGKKPADQTTTQAEKTSDRFIQLAKKPSSTPIVTPVAKKNSTDKDSLIEENLQFEKNTITEPPVISKEENLPVAKSEKVTDEKPSTTKEPVFAALEEPDAEPTTERSVHKMALSVMAAPAYNGVNNLSNGNVGNDFGLLVSYEIAKNWRVSTGGIYAKKLYDTGFSNYNPKNNIWKEYYPNRVNADCRVLDIPVNLSYTFFKGKNSTISIGSGISSYIMLKEKYQFTYAETDPEDPLSYEIVNENRHWLSVVNFQASLEQRLSKRISISLQPYLKLPLANIGFAGVKLQSLGMAANLNWNFSL